MSHELARHEVLDAVNEVRRDLGYPALDALPRGVPEDVCRCPLAVAFSRDPNCPNVVVGTHQAVIYPPSREGRCDDRNRRAFTVIRLSSLLSDFVRGVDDGEFPELVEESSTVVPQPKPTEGGRMAKHKVAVTLPTSPAIERYESDPVAIQMVADAEEALGDSTVQGYPRKFDKQGQLDPSFVQESVEAFTSRGGTIDPGTDGEDLTWALLHITQESPDQVAQQADASQSDDDGGVDLLAELMGGE